MADIDPLCNDRRIQQLRGLLLRRSQRCFRHLRRHRGHDQPEQQNQSKEKRDPILFHPCILSFRQQNAAGIGCITKTKPNTANRKKMMPPLPILYKIATLCSNYIHPVMPCQLHFKSVSDFLSVCCEPWRKNPPPVVPVGDRFQDLFPGCSCHCAPRAQTGRAHINEPDKQNKAKENSADIIPRILVHGEDERRADTAGADKAEHGCLTDIDIEPVEHSRGKRRAKLRQHCIANARQQRDAMARSAS